MTTDEDVVHTGTMVRMNSGYAAFCTIHQLSENTQFVKAQLICRELNITSSRMWEHWEFVNENTITTESLYLSLQKIGAVQ